MLTEHVDSRFNDSKLRLLYFWQVEAQNVIIFWCLLICPEHQLKECTVVLTIAYSDSYTFWQVTSVPTLICFSFLPKNKNERNEIKILPPTYLNKN